MEIMEHGTIDEISTDRTIQNFEHSDYCSYRSIQ
jgi:hypothetical protein